VVLKGAGSVLAYADGGFDINASGGPALATAGSGDVLAGMLGALLAQGLAPKNALRYAVSLHGAAADALVAQSAGPLGVVASELATAARALVNQAAARLRPS
jgi:NAD(P)H-hydrate repair Nnr-like enzyme with NAD(P)H-hydrate dehydratase domain